MLNGKKITDSADIIAYISENYLPEFLGKHPEIKRDNFLPEDTEKWNEWSEKKLAVLLYPNITRSFDESWECFNYANSIESWNVVEQKLVQSIGSVAMSFANGKIKKKYNIVNEREELYKILDDWISAVDGKDFLHGSYVTLPDLLVYGVLRAVQGFRTFDDIMREKPALKVWYDRVASSVQSS